LFLGFRRFPFAFAQNFVLRWTSLVSNSSFSFMLAFLFEWMNSMCPFLHSSSVTICSSLIIDFTVEWRSFLSYQYLDQTISLFSTALGKIYNPIDIPLRLIYQRKDILVFDKFFEDDKFLQPTNETTELKENILSSIRCHWSETRRFILQSDWFIVHFQQWSWEFLRFDRLCVELRFHCWLPSSSSRCDCLR